MEWSLIEYGANRDYLATSHLTNVEEFGADFARQEAQLHGDVREADHNHPNDPLFPQTIFGPSGCFDGDMYTAAYIRTGIRQGDLGFANSLMMYNKQYSWSQGQWIYMPIIFKVYDQASNTIYQFNNNDVLNTTPWR